MKNNSKVPIEFRVNLDSSNTEHRRENEFKRFQMLESLEHKCAIGINNLKRSTRRRAYLNEFLIVV